MALSDSFFFQAEDGIRTYRVTGVQTCALPISIERDRPVASHQRPQRGGEASRVKTAPINRFHDPGGLAAHAHQPRCRTVRSEERRVGKESREQRAAYKERESCRWPLRDRFRY